MTTQSYDPAGNLWLIVNQGSSSPVNELAYTYDKSNHRITQSEDDGTITTWTYDPAYQLTYEQRAGGPEGTSYILTHVYDPAGNQTAQGDDVTATLYTYSPANRLISANAAGETTAYTYDPAGNRTSESGPDSYSDYVWDTAGRMVVAEVESGTITFTYDADGKRTAKQGTDGSATGFLYDGKRLLHETDDVGGEITNTYAAGTNDEYGDLIGGGSEPTHQYDALSNTAALLDDSGQPEAKYKYTAFGEVQSVSIEGGPWSREDWDGLPPELNTHMLAGGRKQYYLDPETELYLLGSGNSDQGGRYYDPATARFVSEDPIRQAHGDPNLFPYVNNDPVNKLDPSGHDDRDPDQDKRRVQQAQQQKPNSAPASNVGGGISAEGGSGSGSASSGGRSTPQKTDSSTGHRQATREINSQPSKPTAAKPVPSAPQNLSKSSWTYNGRHYYLINGKAYPYKPITVDAHPASTLLSDDERPTDDGERKLHTELGRFNDDHNVQTDDPRESMYESGPHHTGKITYQIPDDKEDPEATKAITQGRHDGSAGSPVKDEAPSAAGSSTPASGGVEPTKGSTVSKPMTQPSTGGSGGGSTTGTGTKTVVPATQPTTGGGNPPPSGQGPAGPQPGAGKPPAGPQPGAGNPPPAGPGPAGPQGRHAGPPHVGPAGPRPQVHHGPSGSGPTLAPPGATDPRNGSQDAGGPAGAASPAGAQLAGPNTGPAGSGSPTGSQAPSWAARFVGGAVLAAIVLPTFILVPLLILAIAADVVDPVTLALTLIVALGVTLAFQIDKRRAQGQNWAQSILGGVADFTGISGLIAGFFDRDVATGKKLNLSPEERGFMTVAGPVQILMTVLGVKGLFGAPEAKPAIPPSGDDAAESGVQPVAGRMPINSKYAGQTYPVEKLPPDLQVKYPNSVQFKPSGFPDYSPYSKAEVRIKGLTGDYTRDEAMANKAAGLTETPKDYVWHHVEDGKTMQLVPKDLHAAVRHTGGAAVIRSNAANAGAAANNSGN